MVRPRAVDALFTLALVAVTFAPFDGFSSYPRETGPVKPKLLVVELWGLGDLVIATPFLQAACEQFRVTLLAKPYAQDLRPRFWPEVKVVSFTAPWTAFKGKYRLSSWPWKQMWSLRKLTSEKFDFGLSARWDPRDHLLLRVAGAKARFGFSRMGSQLFLTQPLKRPDPTAHRYEHWLSLAHALGFHLPPREQLSLPQQQVEGSILVHTGAGQPVRVWDLARYRNLVGRLRQRGYHVQVACDPDQRKWWLDVGESEVATPLTVAELLQTIDRSALFVGNDSGPGHLSAFCGVPTFTIFGPQLPEWFAPLHPASAWVEGKACPFKPCSDYCRFPIPYCMVNSSEDEVWHLLNAFVDSTLPLSIH
jgi:ADP-heptose:LPS heptosyltransferase